MVAHEPGSPGDPVRRSQTLKRKSRYTNDTVIQFDSSAGAGVVPPHAIYSGLWTVLQIPFGQLGQMPKRPTGRPRHHELGGRAHRLSVLCGCFQSAVTANAIVSILGNAATRPR